MIHAFQPCQSRPLCILQLKKSSFISLLILLLSRELFLEFHSLSQHLFWRAHWWECFCPHLVGQLSPPSRLTLLSEASVMIQLLSLAYFSSTMHLVWLFRAVLYSSLSIVLILILQIQCSSPPSSSFLWDRLSNVKDIWLHDPSGFGWPLVAKIIVRYGWGRWWPMLPASPSFRFEWLFVWITLFWQGKSLIWPILRKQQER